MVRGAVAQPTEVVDCKGYYVSHAIDVLGVGEVGLDLCDRRGGSGRSDRSGGAVRENTDATYLPDSLREMSSDLPRISWSWFPLAVRENGSVAVGDVVRELAVIEPIYCGSRLKAWIFRVTVECCV